MKAKWMWALAAAAMITAGGVTAPKSALGADEKPKKERIYMTPAEAGPDYKVQGEYTGEADGVKVGLQVIALGDANFHATFYAGGLPGDGWDGKTRIASHMDNGGRVDSDGQTAGDKTVLEPKGSGWSATLTGDTATIKTKDGKTIQAKKVMRESPTMGAKAPDGAVILFDGTNADAWQGGHMSDIKTLMAGPKTKQSFKSYTLHLEFLLPFRPWARAQERSNSGVYQQDMCEVQVLDSFGLTGENNECGGIYQQYKPLVNACFPPLSWQTYDIEFDAAQWDGDKKTKNAVLTVKQNGITVQDHISIKPSPGGGTKENPNGGPIFLQGHGNPVQYRNIWIVEKK